MANIDVIKSIEKSFASGGKVKVYMNNRAPIFGKFVKMNDYDDLFGKMMIRFVSSPNIEEFDLLESKKSPNAVYLTRIHIITSMYLIKSYDNVTI